MNKVYKLSTDPMIFAMREELASARTSEYRTKLHKTRTTKIISSVIYILIVAALLTVLTSVIYAKRTGAAPNLFGMYIYNIETDSMYPDMPAGSVIVSFRPANPSALPVGTTVTFRTTEGERVTHRIVEITTDDTGATAYRTKGDNPVNTVDNEILTPDRIEAVFKFKVPLF